MLEVLTVPNPFSILNKYVRHILANLFVTCLTSDGTISVYTQNCYKNERRNLFTPRQLIISVEECIKDNIKRCSLTVDYDNRITYGAHMQILFSFEVWGLNKAHE